MMKSLINKFKQSSSSVKWTVLFATIAVVSIAAIGFKPISYAAPNTTAAPDSFVADETNAGTAEGQVVYGIGVMKYTANNGEFQVFCLEHDKDYAESKTYVKGASQDSDYGLNYILRNSYPAVDDGTDAMDQTWVTQVAIWYYLGQLSEDEISKAKAANIVLWNKVEALATAANAASDPVDELSFEINGDTFTTTSDGNYMISSLVTVSGAPEDIFKSYDIILEGSPEGTVVLDESLNEMENLTGLSPQTKFYIKVPVDKITEETSTFALKIKGYYQHYRSYKYSTDDPDDQTIVLVEPVVQTLEKSVDLTLRQKVETVDTASTAGKAIYFIGLIILLSGAGIIYANIREKQERA